MSVGANIYRFRKRANLTQEKLAEMMDVSFQAVSSWERDEYRPDTDNLILLAEKLDVSLTQLIFEEPDILEPAEAPFNWEHMKTFVKTTAKTLGLEDAHRSVDFAEEAHRGQTKKKSDLPFIAHPLTVACHALSLGIKDDAVIAACLLHDVMEDCKKEEWELPVGDEAKHLVKLLTHSDTCKQNPKEMKKYISDIAANPKAALVKCLDRCNNITTMAQGFSRPKIADYIRETETYIMPLLEIIKAVPEYNNAAWLLKYQMRSALDIYKRLL